MIILTDSSFDAGGTLCAHATRIADAFGTGRGIVVVGASTDDRAAVSRQSAAMCATGDVLCRARLMTVPAKENAQRLVGLLGALGLDSELLDPATYAPITRGNALEAEPRLLHARRFEDSASRARVLVIAGGVGRTPEGDCTSLGTGGADLSGLFIAQRLGLGSRLVVSPEDAASGYELPKRAMLFARRHGVRYSIGAEVLPVGLSGLAVSA